MHRNIELERMRSSGRPSSSPSRIDPRTKIPKEQVGVDGILIEHGIEPTEIRYVLVDIHCDYQVADFSN